MSLKKIIKKVVFKIFDPVALRLGYRKKKVLNNTQASTIDTYAKNNLLHTFYSLLKSIDYVPKHIVDVGANHGTWTREALKMFPDCKFTLLEPQAWMKESIKDILEINPKVSFNAVGAGKQSGVFKFTIVDRDDSCSFIYSETEAKEKEFKQIEIPVITLNELIEAQNLPIPDIIKIDAEGLDIEVLEGAGNFFGKTEVFMVEAGIVCKTIPNNFLQVMNYMDENGYRLFEITDLNRPFPNQVLWLAELVFIKKDGIIDSHKWI